MTFSGWLSSLRRHLPYRGPSERDLDEEIRSTFDLLVDERVRAGMTLASAKRAAAIEIGGVEQVKEHIRVARSGALLETIVRDVRHAARMLAKSPGFTLVVILTLALGIGSTTTVFSVINTALLRPLPYPDPDRIVMLVHTGPTGETSWNASVSLPKFSMWRQSTTAFQEVSVYRFGFMNLTGRDEPEQVVVGHVSTDFFRLFGARVAQGRTFSEDETRHGANVALLSHALWQGQFGGTLDIVGQTVSLDGDLCEVIGILETDFDTNTLLPSSDLGLIQVFQPLRVDDADSGSHANAYEVAARLRPGMTFDVAQAQTRLATTAFRQAFPGILRPERNLAVQPIHDVLVRDVRSPLMILAGSVGLVLLIVCANIANLLLVRASVRQHEFAIRSAVGASRGRIARQLLTESLVLSTAGGALGVWVGLMGIRALVASQSWSIAAFRETASGSSADWRVFVFTIFTSLATGLAFGMIPSWQVSRTNFEGMLKDGTARSGSGARHHKVRTILVISEVAFAVVLVIGAALLIRSFITLRRVTPGIDTHDVLTMRMGVGGRRFVNTAAVSRLVGEGVRQVGALPGVEAAAATLAGAPLDGGGFISAAVVGRPAEDPAQYGYQQSSPGYFEVFKIPLIRGRLFTDRDGRDAPPVVIINQTMARRLWPHQGDPLNDRLILGKGLGPEEDVPRQIVGIVGDVRHLGLNQDPFPSTYIPLAQMPDPQMMSFNSGGGFVTWAVRTRGSPELQSSAIQRELRQASGGLPIARIRTMEEVSAASTATAQSETSLMTMFGVAALLLAAIGVYGVITYSVQQRVHEIGIRMALGADARMVRNMVIRQGIGLSGVGIGLGLVAALGLTPLLATVLYGVTPYDWKVFVAVPMVLSAVAFLAILLPARVATRVDPISALKRE